MSGRPAKRVVPAVSMAAAGGLWVLALVWAREHSEPARLVLRLEWLSPAACAFSLSALLGAVVVCRREIAGTAAALSGRGWVALLGVLLAALAVRLTVVPATERLYYDEHTYLQLARGIAEEGRARVAGVAVIDQRGYRCRMGSYPHWPSGWPVLMAAFLRPGGYSRSIPSALNLTLSLMTTLLVALVAASLVPSRPLWLAAAASHACFSANQVWSRSSASEVFGAFAAVLAVLAATRFALAPGVRLGLFLTATLAVAAQVRNELAWILPVAAVFVASVGGARALRSMAAPFSAAVLLLVPQAMHIGVLSRGYDPILTEGSGFGVQYVVSNASSLVGYVRTDWVVLGGAILAAVGASSARLGRAAWALWFWILCAILPGLFYFAGSYAFPGGERFALAWLPPLALAAGRGLDVLHSSFRAHWARRLEGPVWTALLVGALLYAGPSARVVDRKTATPRADCAFLRTALHRVPLDGMVITSDPPAVIAEGRSAAFLLTADSDQPFLAELAAQYANKLFYYASPSSAAAQWPGGVECERRLLSRFAAETVASEPAANGLRVLSQLRPVR